jgi:hypothetical protein
MAYSDDVRRKMKSCLRELREMRRLNKRALEFGRLFNRPHVVKEALDFAPKLNAQIKDWKKALAR